MQRSIRNLCIVLSLFLVCITALKVPSGISLQNLESSFGTKFTTTTSDQSLCDPFTPYSAVTCEVTDDYILINSTGIPNEAGTFPNKYDPNSITTQHFIWKIPRNPQILSSPYTSVPQGPIGVAINGVPFYWWTDANGDDAVVNEGISFDACDGHPDQNGRYHYHENPVCLYPSNYKEPPFLGYMFDGFPVYGLNDEAELDSCGGMDTDDGYRYYVTSTYPYIIGCYTGQPEASNFDNGHNQPPSGGQQGGQQHPPQQQTTTQQQGGQQPPQQGNQQNGGQQQQPPQQQQGGQRPPQQGSQQQGGQQPPQQGNQQNGGQQQQGGQRPPQQGNQQPTRNY